MEYASPDRNPPTSEENFWTRYHAYRRAKMPIESGIYGFLENYYENLRSGFEVQWHDAFDRPIPADSLRYYNELFRVAHAAVKNVFRKYPVSARSRMLADKAYGVQLKPGDTLRDLMKLDVFGEKTINQDIHPEYIFGKMRAIYKEQPTLVSDTHHFFFHNPQQSEHIFLHEIIVGYLLNEVEFQGEIHSPEGLPLIDQTYPPFAAYAMQRLAKLMRKTPGQILALHFEPHETVTKALPAFVQELMLAASHIYWYLDFFSKRLQRHSPSSLLVLTYNFFVVASIERQMTEGNLRLRPQAGKFVDRLMHEKLVHMPIVQLRELSDVHLVRVLMTCSEQLWRPRHD